MPTRKKPRPAHPANPAGQADPTTTGPRPRTPRHYAELDPIHAQYAVWLARIVQSGKPEHIRKIVEFAYDFRFGSEDETKWPRRREEWMHCEVKALTDRSTLQRDISEAKAAGNRERFSSLFLLGMHRRLTGAVNDFLSREVDPEEIWCLWEILEAQLAAHEIQYGPTVIPPCVVPAAPSRLFDLFADSPRELAAAQYLDRRHRHYFGAPVAEPAAAPQTSFLT